MRDKTTDLPMFTTLSVTLACAKCREDGKAADCPHMLHLVPRWQSSDRHLKLKTVMQDRPDLIESELSGLAFDSLQQVFRGPDLDIMFSQTPPAPVVNEAVHLFIDPAAGGPSSDYAILSIRRHKGLVTVRSQQILPRRLLVRPPLPVDQLLVPQAVLGHPLAFGPRVPVEALPPREGPALLSAELDGRHQPREHPSFGQGGLNSL